MQIIHIETLTILLRMCIPTVLETIKNIQYIHGLVQHIMSYLNIFCPSGGLATIMVTCLTAAKFQPLMSSAFGITLSPVPKLLSQFCKISAYYLRNYVIGSHAYLILQSTSRHVSFKGRFGAWKYANHAGTLFYRGCTFPGWASTCHYMPSWCSVEG